MITTTHNEKESHYYDSVYAQGYSTTNYYPLYQHVVRLLEQDNTRHSVLEIGCGVGDLGKLIIERGHGYRGFDFSPVAVERSRTLCPQGDFRVGDAYDAGSYLPPDYDTAVALEVLEHLDDFKVINSIPIGVRLVASVPDYDDVAHLRLYKDPQRDILERFKRVLHITDIISLTGTGNAGEQKTIYLFQGRRVASDQERSHLSSVESKRPAGSSPHTSLVTSRVGRNELCPCGSGRKFKKCCLA